MDIGIAWDAQNFRGDWSLTAGDLATDPGGLRSAVLLSLFTDRSASNDYIAPAGEPFDRHGWWGDTYEPSLIGSRLWQLNRVKKSNSLALLAQAEDICQEALQWLLDAGVVATISVDTTWIAAGVIGIQVVIAEPRSPPQTFNFSWAWQGIGPMGTPVPIYRAAPGYLGDPSGGLVGDPSGGFVGSP